MIAFGSTIIDPVAYRRYAQPGVRGAAEADSEVFVFSAIGPAARGYNLLLDTAAKRDDLEALVLVHSHAQIDDPRLCSKVRAALSDPDVGVVGCAGARGVRSLAWWDGEISAGTLLHRYQEHGGGELPAYAWTSTAPAPADVDVVDGVLMVLSPWVVRNVRFDEALALGHGFDVDFCLQVGQAGKRVVTADIRVTHHRSLELFADRATWVEAHMQLAEKWDRSGAEPSMDWKARARSAEAHREAQRAITYGNELTSDARVLALERAAEETVGSRSWRLTAPLRRANAAVRARRRRGSG